MGSKRYFLNILNKWEQFFKNICWASLVVFLIAFGHGIEFWHFLMFWTFRFFEFPILPLFFDSFFRVKLKKLIKVNCSRAWEYHQRFLLDERFRNQYSILIFVEWASSYEHLNTKASTHSTSGGKNPLFFVFFRLQNEKNILLGCRYSAGAYSIV